MSTRLKIKRQQQGLTQAMVAKEANISEVSYQRIEYGSQTPSLKTAILIAETLNSTVEELFRVKSSTKEGALSNGAERRREDQRRVGSSERPTR